MRAARASARGGVEGGRACATGHHSRLSACPQPSNAVVPPASPASKPDSLVEGPHQACCPSPSPPPPAPHDGSPRRCPARAACGPGRARRRAREQPAASGAADASACRCCACRLCAFRPEQQQPPPILPALLQEPTIVDAVVMDHRNVTAMISRCLQVRPPSHATRWRRGGLLPVAAGRACAGRRPAAGHRRPASACIGPHAQPLHCMQHREPHAAGGVHRVAARPSHE